MDSSLEDFHVEVSLGNAGEKSPSGNLPVQPCGLVLCGDGIAPPMQRWFATLSSLVVPCNDQREELVLLKCNSPTVLDEWLPENGPLSDQNIYPVL
jgi:hypothetical protein